MIDKITNTEEYAEALLRVEELMDSEVGTPEGQELNELVELVIAYEDINYPMPGDVPYADQPKRGRRREVYLTLSLKHGLAKRSVTGCRFGVDGSK